MNVVVRTLVYEFVYKGTYCMLASKKLLKPACKISNLITAKLHVYHLAGLSCGRCIF